MSWAVQVGVRICSAAFPETVSVSADQDGGGAPGIEWEPPAIPSKFTRS